MFWEANLYEFSTPRKATAGGPFTLPLLNTPMLAS